LRSSLLTGAMVLSWLAFAGMVFITLMLGAITAGVWVIGVIVTCFKGVEPDDNQGDDEEGDE